MPPLTMHMTLVRELAGQVAHASLRADPGAYYLGATTPDIRVLTRWDRERTHFFNLNEYGEQSGVAGIFEAHPELASPSRLNESTVAFLCGYISHLEMDEEWIVDVYRPCFGKRSPLKGDVLANLLDRILQYELDRHEREDPEAVEEIRRDLLATSVEAITGFVDPETLKRWREISANLLLNPTDWDRFRIIGGRHLRAYGVKSEEDVAHFLRNVPDLLDQAIREVTPERIKVFQEKSRQRALSAVREYLT
jgi:hypothetical protein